MTNVYMIEGQTGEYSDCVIWTFRALFNEEYAKSLVSMLNKELVTRGLHYDTICCLNNNKEKMSEMRELDPKFYCDYTGSRYTLKIIEVE